MRRQLAEARAKLSVLHDSVIEAVQKMLGSDDLDEVKEGVKTWKDLQSKAHAQDMETWRYMQEREERTLEHLEKMSGPAGGPGGSWIAAANQAE